MNYNTKTRIEDTDGNAAEEDPLPGGQIRRGLKKTELSSDDIINSSRNLHSKPMNNLVEIAD